MTKLKVLKKETIAVDLKHGKSLLIINKKKKLSANSKVTFEGRNIINIATENTKRINNTFMSLIKVYLTSLNPLRTTGKQCFEVISNYSGLSLQESEVKLKETLNNLLCPNTESMLKSFPFKLEAYEKQRLMLALAFLIKPKLIVLDDTIFKMEPEIKSYALKELSKLKEENNTSLIFISKKIDIIDEVIDDIAIMYKGTIVEYGQKDSILNDPLHPYTRYHIDHKGTPDFTETSSEIEEYIKNINSMRITGCSFCLKCKNASCDCIYMPPKIKTIGEERQVICEDTDIAV